MNDFENSLGRMMVEAADTVHTRPPSRLLDMAEQPLRRSRPVYRFVIASIAAAAVAAVTIGIYVSAISPQSERVQVADATSAGEEADVEPSLPTLSAYREPSADQLELADVVRKNWKVAETSRVWRATAVLADAVVPRSNTGKQCLSGQVLEVTLFGEFSDAAVAGRIGEVPPKITGTRLLADARSGEVCLVSLLADGASESPYAVEFWSEGP